LQNPVGKEWRWVVDDPLMIVEEGIARHQQMIKAFKGVPGLKQDRWVKGPIDCIYMRHQVSCLLAWGDSGWRT
jgi:hypothetical protein